MAEIETLVVQIFAAISAFLSFLAALLIWRGNILSRRALVQPRIFVHGSLRDERMQIGVGPHHLAPNQIDMHGIFVENIGRGVAVKGTIYVIDSRGQQRPIVEPHENYSFLRIPEGHRYHYPSFDCPLLEGYVGGQTIHIRVQYFDINDNEYWLSSTEENIDLPEE